tara:strand:- start:347 stop:586 length:240 start_codon:yes stop_codon:yes gene_type:complete
MLKRRRKSKLEEQNDKFATTYFDESLGLEVYMTEEPPKHHQQGDMVYLDKIGRAIERTCFFFLGVSLMGLIIILFWNKF